ncbi:serine hydrolase domain-containing protein [Alienimonas sp. DA493]|uniref:serine hydrolase domain-containing protein n=1 Tax=Alienimonas sp. DA493 TaxID=3373605 RepID=UPI0037553F7E
MSLDALPKTRAVLEQGREDGLHHGAQLFVQYRGEIVCDAAIGEARPGEPLTAEHVMLWLSAGKPVTAAAIVVLCDGPGSQPFAKLALDGPVVRHVPEFARGGAEKRAVTVRHLLTHTAGLPNVDPGYPEVDWDESVRRICDAPLEEDWVVGRTAGYHPKSSWFLLGEIVRRIVGEPADAWMERTMLGPAGIEGLRFRFSPEELADVRPRLAPTFRRQGRELIDADLLTDAHLTRWSPGSSLRGTARSVGDFYSTLNDSRADCDFPLMGELAAEAIIARHRVGEFDRTLGHVVDFGLGVIVDSNRYGAETVPYGFGPHCSPRTFGHGGSQSTMAFCDPENDLVVAWATNGMCGEPKHQRRNRAINAAIYEDLGLS